MTDFAGIGFDGNSSNLGSALRTLAERYRGAPVAGLLLFSDGNATDLGATLPDLKGMPPIYPVVADRESADDKRPATWPWPSVRASQTLFEDTPVTIDAKVEAAASAGARSTSSCATASRQVVAQPARHRRGADQQTLPVRFQVRPAAPGLVPYRVTVTGGRDEATPLNNSRLLLVERPHGGPRASCTSAGARTGSTSSCAGRWRTIGSWSWRR